MDDIGCCTSCLHAGEHKGERTQCRHPDPKIGGHSHITRLGCGSWYGWCLVIDL